MPFQNKMRIIISGASGFLGANLASFIFKNKVFMSKVQKVVLVDSLQYGNQKIDKEILENKKFQFIKASIYDNDVVEKIIKKGDVVVHLATDMNTFDNPQTGKNMTIDLDAYLKALLNKKISKFIFFSTANVYGINDSKDLLETDILKPTTHYSASKITFEALLQVYFYQYNFPALIFRPVTIFGPYQHPGWLVPLSITRLLKNEKIQITSGGKMRRDWIFVDDVCDLIIRVVLSKKVSIFGEIYNIGTGKEETVMEIAEYLLKKFNKTKSCIKYLPPRAGDIPREITFASKAKKAFNWKPNIDFYKGLDITIDWFKKHQNQQ